MRRLPNVNFVLAIGLFLFPLLGRPQGEAVSSGGATVTQIQSSEGQQDTKQDQRNAQQKAFVLSEPQALDLALAVQATDRETGKLGQEKGQQDSVTTLAAQLEKDHHELEIALDNIEKAKKMTPQKSPLSESMQKTWQARIENLKKMKKGKDFDKAFLEHEVKFHQEALQLVQTGLKASAKDPDLKNVMQRAESTLKTHLQRALYVQKAYSNEGLTY
jgi:putative membrane protein